MVKNLFISSFKKIPRAFLSVALLALVFEGGNLVFDDFFYAPPFYGFRVNVLNEFTQAPGHDYDIIAFGDSYNARGIMPEILEKETGLSCYNLSTYFRESILAPYCYLKNYIASCDKKPKYIIMGFIMKSCALEKKDAEVPFFHDYAKGNYDVLSGEFGIPVTSQFLIPSLKHQYFFRLLFTDPGSLRFKEKDGLDAVVEKIHENNGYYLYQGYAEYTEKAKDHWAGSKFIASDYFDKYLRKMLTIAKDNDITVIYSIPTRPPDWYELDEEYGAMDDYRNYMKDLQKEYPNLVVIDPQLQINEESMYESLWHTNWEGSLILNDILARRINDLE